MPDTDIIRPVADPGRLRVPDTGKIGPAADPERARMKRQRKKPANAWHLRAGACFMIL